MNCVMYRIFPLCKKVLQTEATQTFVFANRTSFVFHNKFCRRTYAEAVPKRKKPGQGKGPITWKNVALTAGVAGIVYFGMKYLRYEKEMELEKERSKNLGKARIGGPFNLVNHHGLPQGNKDFFGKWLILYFGFTHCPDICPDEIEKMCEAVDLVDAMDNTPNLIPLFISVDPARDTVDAVKQYVEEFSSKLIGLTGSKEQVAEACKSYRVYSSAGPRDDDDDYIVDHTIIMYLLDSNGDFVDYYGQNKTADEIASSVAIHMLKHSASQGGFFRK